MSIKKKLIGMLTIILTIMMGVSIFSVIKLSDVNEESTIIANEIIPELNGAHDLNFYIARYRSTEFKHIILSTDKDMSDAEEQMNKFQTSIDRSLEELKAKNISGIDEILSTWESYKSTHTEFIKLSRNNDQNGSMALLMGDMKTQYDAMAEFAGTRVESENQDALNESARGDQLYVQSLITLIVVCITAVVIGIILGILLLKSILNPVKRFQKELSVLAESGGDLTKKIDINTKDEMGDMAKALNGFLHNLREIIKEVNEKATAVLDSSEYVRTRVESLNGNISDSSATIEELSAGMEETAASAEEVNVSSNEIVDVVSSLSEKASQGADVVVDISQRASELKHNAANSQDVAIRTYDNSRKQLEIAISKAEEIEQINVLSNSIMEISNQTNLLALNASIEAARAGEAGRGFAVVASEIGSLADNSKTTVSEIQKITGAVVDAVRDLSNGTKNLIQFMDGTVLNDYNSFVNVGDAYGKDAGYVDELVTDISASSQEMTATVEGIMSAIEEVTLAMNQGAEGTQDVAKRMTEIAQIADEVDMQSKESAENAKLLKAAVSKFTV
jgi:methyl-accepting chemotaxis protein